MCPPHQPPPAAPEPSAPNRSDEADERWTAVVARDRQAAGAFVYAVLTTGIYCRPGCPARTPRRHNVAFFAGSPEAAAAGFRPCKRCRPDAPG